MNKWQFNLNLLFWFNISEFYFHNVLGFWAMIATVSDSSVLILIFIKLLFSYLLIFDYSSCLMSSERDFKINNRSIWINRKDIFDIEQLARLITISLLKFKICQIFCQLDIVSKIFERQLYFFNLILTLRKVGIASSARQWLIHLYFIMK